MTHILKWQGTRRWSQYDQVFKSYVFSCQIFSQMERFKKTKPFTGRTDEYKKV